MGSHFWPTTETYLDKVSVVTGGYVKSPYWPRGRRIGQQGRVPAALSLREKSWVHFFSARAAGRGRAISIRPSAWASNCKPSPICLRAAAGGKPFFDLGRLRETVGGGVCLLLCAEHLPFHNQIRFQNLVGLKDASKPRRSMPCPCWLMERSYCCGETRRSPGERRSRQRSRSHRARSPCLSEEPQAGVFCKNRSKTDGSIKP
jgi:hypothetical protein